MGYMRKATCAFCSILMAIALSTQAVEPGDVVLNEVYFNLLESPEPNHFEAVELLVVQDNLDLNGLQVSDRDIWDRPAEDQCTLQDLGQGFLRGVKSGTLIVLFNGAGEDDTDSSDFLLRFFATSSLYCNVAPTTNAFRIADQGDNLHLLHSGRQVDFLRYLSKTSKRRAGEPGTLTWHGGNDGFIEIGDIDENVGFRFHGDKPELNDYPAAWLPYSEPTTKASNLGQPNGGRNTDWIEQLRKKKTSQARVAPAPSK